MDERDNKNVIPYDDRKKVAQDFKSLIKVKVTKKRKTHEKESHIKKANNLVEVKKIEAEKEGITFEKMNKEEKYTTLKNEGFMIKNFLNSYIKKKHDKKIDINQLEEELFDDDTQDIEIKDPRILSNSSDKKNIEHKHLSSQNITTYNSFSGSINKKASRTNLPSESINDSFMSNKDHIESVAYGYFRNTLKSNMQSLMHRMRKSISVSVENPPTNNQPGNSTSNLNFLRRGSERKQSSKLETINRLSSFKDKNFNKKTSRGSISLTGSNFIENLKNKKRATDNFKISKRNSVDVSSMNIESYNKLNDLSDATPAGNNLSNKNNQDNSPLNNLKFKRRASAAVDYSSSFLKNNFANFNNNDANNSKINDSSNISNKLLHMKSGSLLENKLENSNSNAISNVNSNLEKKNNPFISNKSFISKNSGTFANPNSFLAIINKKILEISEEDKNLNTYNNTHTGNNLLNEKTSKYNNYVKTGNEVENIKQPNKKDSRESTNILFISNDTENLSHRFTPKDKKFSQDRLNSECPLKSKENMSEREFTSDGAAQDNKNNTKEYRTNFFTPALKKKNNSDLSNRTIVNKEKSINMNLNNLDGSLDSNSKSSKIEKSKGDISKKNSKKSSARSIKEPVSQEKEQNLKISSEMSPFNVKKVNSPSSTTNKDKRDSNNSIISNLQIFNSSVSRINNIFRGRTLVKLSKVYDSLSDEEIEENFDFLIHPDSKLKETWDFLILLVTLYTITFVPYNMAYLDLDTMALLVIDLVCDIIYILDLVFQFFIPIQDYDEKFITSKFKIAINYLSSWFVLDFLSSAPINSVLSLILLMNQDEAKAPYGVVVSKLKVSKNLTNIAKLSRMYRLMKLVRLVKLIKISKNQKVKFKEKMNILEDMNISSTLKRLLVFLFYFVLLNHVLACIWTFVGSLEYPNWIVDQNLSDGSNLELYIASLYFNLVTIFTVGYGNIISKNSLERVYNIIIMIAGIMLYTFAVSSLSNIIQRTDEKTQSFNKNLNYLEESKVRYNIPQSLYSKVKRYLTYDYTVNRINKHFLLTDLPQVIRSELICRMYADMISNFNFFQNTNTEFCAKVILALRPMKSNKGEVIIYENEYIEEMVLVKRGVLSIEKKYKESLVRLVELRRREHFGEIFMLLNERCTYNVSVKTNYCEMLLIKKIDLIDICSEFQDIFEQISNKSTYNMLIIKNRFETMKAAIDRRSSIGVGREKLLMERENNGKFLNSFENESNSNASSPKSKKKNHKSDLNGINEIIEENSLDEEDYDSDNSSSSSSSGSGSSANKTYAKINTNFGDLANYSQGERSKEDIMNTNAIFFTSSPPRNKCVIENTKLNAFDVIEENEDDENDDEGVKKGSTKNLDIKRSSTKKPSEHSNPYTIIINKVENIPNNNFDEEENSNYNIFSADNTSYRNNNSKRNTTKSQKNSTVVLKNFKEGSVSSPVSNHSSMKPKSKSAFSKNKHKLDNAQAENTHSASDSSEDSERSSSSSNLSEISLDSQKKTKVNNIKSRRNSKSTHNLHNVKFSLGMPTTTFFSDNTDSKSGGPGEQNRKNSVLTSLTKNSMKSRNSKLNISDNLSATKSKILRSASISVSSNVMNEIKLNLNSASPPPYKRMSVMKHSRSINSLNSANSNDSGHKKGELLNIKNNSKNYLRKNSHSEFTTHIKNSNSNKLLTSEYCPTNEKSEGNTILDIKLRKKSLTLIDNPDKNRRATFSPSLSLKEGSMNTDIQNQKSEIIHSTGILSLFNKASVNKNLNPNLNTTKISDTKEKNDSFKSVSKIENKSSDKYRHSGIVKPAAENKKLSIDSSFFNRVRDPNLRRNTLLIGSTINTNIKKGSQNIKDPNKFYSGIFEKWKMDEQNKRLKMLYKKLKNMK